jgi:hypothetical protein
MFWGVRFLFGAKGQTLNYSAWWFEFARKPPHRVGVQRIDGDRFFFDAVAGRALKRAILETPRAGTDPGKTHPVFTGRTHRPISNDGTHPNTLWSFYVRNGIFSVR